MASLLSSVINNTDKVMEYIGTCKRMGVEVQRPDINTGTLMFSASDKGISFGLMAIKNVGEGFVREIVNKRKTGKYLSLEDFLSRMSENEINKRMVESLIKAGALDSLGKKRSQLLVVYSDAIDALQRRNHKNVEGQFDMFSAVESKDEDTGSLNISYPEIPELPAFELLSMEKEMTGLYLSGHPLDKYSENAKRLRCDKLSQINNAVAEGDKSIYRDGKTVTLLGLVSSKKEKLTKNDTRMAFVGFEDETGEIELVVFPKVYEANVFLLQPGNVLVVTGEISVKESQTGDDDGQQKEEPKILVRSVFEVKEGQLPEVKTPVNAQDDSKKVKVNLSALMGKESAAPETPVPAKEQVRREQSLKEDLYLKVASRQDDAFRRIQSVLEIYNYGDSEVYIYFEDTKKLVRAVDTRVPLTETVLEALRRILGKDNVKCKEKKGK